MGDARFDRVPQRQRDEQCVKDRQLTDFPEPRHSVPQKSHCSPIFQPFAPYFCLLSA
jgi:hypothetical protein